MAIRESPVDSTWGVAPSSCFVALQPLSLGPLGDQNIQDLHTIAAQ